MIKRLLLLLTIFLPLALQAQYVQLTGKIQASNGLNAADYTINFTPSQSFFIAGTGVVVNTSTSCGTTTDGTVVGTPDPLYPTVVTPQFTGTLPPGNYFVTYTFYTATGTETLPSPEIPAQLTSTGELTVAAPASGIPSNASGMRVYIGNTSGSETLQGQSTGNGSYTQSTPLVSGNPPPTSNSTICQQVANDAGWPAGTGYNVTLVDPAGNTLPGYPMLWQLLGAGTTLNLSNGLPYYHGIVTFPSPILASPLNHALQSISGPLNMQGYGISNVGKLDACSVNGMVNAGSFCFAMYPDMGARINAAIASCAATCTVWVPPGVYAYSTTVVLPLNAFGKYKLLLDAGATLNYSGSSDAILTQITAFPTAANLIIEGGTLLGNAGATSGIHIMPSQHITVRNMTIQQFTGGDAILNEGANMVNIYDNNLTQNQNGYHGISTLCNATAPVICSPTASTGSAFSPNANHVHDNNITTNSHWGIFEEWNAVTGSTGALKNVYRDNNLELNGFGAGNTAFGAVFIMKSVGDTIEGNYFEASPHEVVLGQLTGGAGDFFAASGTTVRDNYFTTSPPISPLPKAYNIELQNTTDVLIEGNAEQGTGGISNTTNCFINASTGGETRTLIGRNAIFQGVGNSSGNPICVNGTAVLSLAGNGSMNFISQNYQSYLAFQNFMTTASTTDTIAAQFLTSNGGCYATPVNAAAKADTLAYISAITNGSLTFTHTATANEQFNIWCANKPVGGFGYP